MAIIGFDKDAVTDYIPEFGGNRDSAKPCIVGLKFVSHGRVMEYAKKMQIQITNKTRGARGDKVSAIQAEVALDIQKKQFLDNVVSVKNYFLIGKDGKKVKCEDVGAFYDNVDTTLITEVIQAMESSSKLTGEQEKN